MALFLNHNILNEMIDTNSYKWIVLGTTNARNNVSIFINNIKRYENIIEDGNIKVDIFLEDGQNYIRFLIEGQNDILIDEKIINVDIMSNDLENQSLLTNFIANDEEFIDFSINNADLYYVDKNAGNDKEIKLDSTIQSHYFSLEGINSNLYKIEQIPDNLPNIQGDIIKRPITINYDVVEKIYDGTSDITREMKLLTLDNGYIFGDIQKEYNDFMGTGFVRGIIERKVVVDTLYSRQTYISNLKTYMINESIFDEDEIINNITNPGLYLYKIINDKNAILYCIGIAYLPKLYNSKLINRFDLPNHNKTITQQNIISNACESWLKSRSIPNIIQLDNKGIDLNSFRVHLDDFMGISDSDGNIYFEDETKFMTITEDGELSIPTDSSLINFIILNKLDVTYKYKEINNDTTYMYKSIESDKDYVSAIFDKAFFKDKNITNNYDPIYLDNLKLEKGSKGDGSGNYQIKNYISSGRIKKRPIRLNIHAISKIYDGSNIVPFTYDFAPIGYTPAIIEYDDVFIKNKYSDNPSDNNHYFTLADFKFLNYKDGSNVSFNSSGNIIKKDITLNSSFTLFGNDAHNYEIADVLISNSEAKILQRDIELKINNIRFIRATKMWEIDYEFINDIKEDNLTLIFNDTTYNEFKFNKKGIIAYQNENDLCNKIDIISKFFSYNPNEYNSINIITDTNTINKSSIYWNENAITTQPNTERIDITVEDDVTYDGSIKLTEKDRYYENKDGSYKLKDKDIIILTNFNIHPDHPKKNNYKLTTTKLEIPINII